MRVAASVLILKSNLSLADKNVFCIGARGAQGPSQNKRRDTVTEKGLNSVIGADIHRGRLRASADVNVSNGKDTKSAFKEMSVLSISLTVRWTPRTQCGEHSFSHSLRRKWTSV